MHTVGCVDPKDLNMKDSGRKFYSISAYSGSKLAQVCGAASAYISTVCRIEVLIGHFVIVIKGCL